MTVVTTGPVADLVAGLGDAVVTDGDTMIAYTRDQALLSPSGRPIAVVRARTVDDVVTTLQTAYRYTIPRCSTLPGFSIRDARYDRHPPANIDPVVLPRTVPTPG
ncbi:hypothetical protein L1080_021385 [Rhodococcus sp. MSC1_016]|jgi:FAD/FMN-containing dehydrogenase|uniref:hypothetical protein n=1 Tax=Rhodococcus sp. MSC1_016 TaxID=2909266 RepID=UPI0035AE1E63